MAGAIYEWNFSTAIVPPPGNKQVCVDQPFATIASIARIWFDDTTANNVAIRPWLLTLPVGAALALQVGTSSTNQLRVNVAAAPIDHTTYVEVPVTFVSVQGTAFANNATVDVLFYTVPPPGTGAPLVSLEDAKTHLFIALSDTTRDADVTMKLAHAEAIILDYLNTTADMRTVTAAWDASTVPPNVQAAILLELGELTADRGDEFLTPPHRWDDSDLRPEIIGLLRRLVPAVLG